MEIILNGAAETLENQSTIAQLLQGRNINSESVAINLNGSIMDREEFDAAELNEGDAVDVLYFMGGGFPV